MKLYLTLILAVAALSACTGNPAVDRFLAAVEEARTLDAASAPETHCVSSSAPDVRLDVGHLGLFTPLLVTSGVAVELYDAWTVTDDTPGSAFGLLAPSVTPVVIDSAEMTVSTIEPAQLAWVRIRSTGGEARVCFAEVR